MMLYEVIMSKRPKTDRYEPVEKVFPEYKGIDEVILAALAPEVKRFESAMEMRQMILEV